MSEQTEYKEGGHAEFIEYLFSKEPQPKNTITLELPLEEPGKNIGLHIFEQLLMIYVDGLKYFYGENGKVSIDALSQEQIFKVNEYFLSIGYQVTIDVFETMHEYQFKFPDYFKNQDRIQNETKLEDFFYEIFDHQKKAYRIYFSEL